MLFLEIVQSKNMPELPNLETQQAMQEVLAGEVEQYFSLDALHQALQAVNFP